MITLWTLTLSALAVILIVTPVEGSSPTCGLHANTETDFVFGLPNVFSHHVSYHQYHKYILYISANTTGRVYIDAPKANFHKVEHVHEGGTKLQLPNSLLQTVYETKENKGIHVHSDIAISASLFVTAGNVNQLGGVTGLHLLPTAALSTDYAVASSDGEQNSVLIVASQNLTIVTLTFPKAFAMDPQHILLDETQTYTVLRNEDISNIRIHSNKPVAVISTVGKASIPTSVKSSESISTSIPPNSHGGTNFIVPALPIRGHYIVRVFATEDATSVTFRNYSRESHTSLYTDLFDEYMFGDDTVTIESDKPILVYQYGTAYDAKGERYGAFMRNIPAVENYVSDVSFIIQDEIPEINNYVTVIVPHSSIVSLDSLPLGDSLARDYTVSGQKYSVFSLIVPEYVGTAHGLIGYHKISSQHGNVSFAAFLAGFKSDRHEAYGLALGMQSRDCHVNQGTGTGSLTNGSSETDIRSLCYQCHDMDLPFICSTFTKCGPSMGSDEQVCYVEKYSTSSNQIRFRSGCIADTQCPTKKRQEPDMVSTEVEGHSRETRDSHLCTECCRHGLCNTHGCGVQEPSPTLRGPLCMSCAHVSSLDACTTTDVCSTDEVCHIEGMDYGIYKHFTLGCKSVQDCHMGGKKRQTRARGRRGTALCDYCCDKDFCNYQCDSSQTQVVVVG